MITLYQEQIPLSNKRLEKQISQDGLYTNPVIMPYAFNSTSEYNSLETVIYIRNNDPSKYYTNIAVTLLKSIELEAYSLSTGIITNNPASGISLSLSTSESPIKLESAFETYNPPSTINLTNKYQSNYVPFSNDNFIDVKFSYGYDELSNYEWSKKKEGLYIPYIGNQSLYDMSYIPIRIKINFLQDPTIFTIRDYFIDISYEDEFDVTGQ